MISVKIYYPSILNLVLLLLDFLLSGHSCVLIFVFQLIDQIPQGNLLFLEAVYLVGQVSIAAYVHLLYLLY